MDTAVDRLRNSLQERFRNESLEVPVLPEIASRVLQIASEEDADPGQLSELIHRDQALAGHLLNAANSSLYGGRMAIVSLQQALARLGLTTICDITFATCVKGKVFKAPGQETRIRSLWKTAMASGAYAREVARHLRRNVETAFLCGLLHNVAKPVLLQVVSDASSENSTDLSDPEIESIFDEFQGAVTEKVVDSWTLPEPVAVALLYHSDYTEAPNFEEQAQITHLARHLGEWVTSPNPDELMPTMKDLPVHKCLNLYPDDVMGLLEKKRSVLEFVDSMS